jgi:tRNA threonylcarbamoyladenosine biosynthesis protein TsaB
MRILLLDTCGATGSVALAEDDVLVAAETLPGRTASERLVATVKALVARAAWDIGTIDVVAVVHGPGSFTGVRVGLSAAKGLCEAVGAKMIAISKLATLAGLAPEGGAGRVCAVMDAGRGEFYFGEYWSGVCCQESLLSNDEVLVAGHESVLVVYEAMVANAFPSMAPRIVREPTAEDALLPALERLRRGSYDDVARIDANYLRRTDAEIFAKSVIKAQSAVE